MPNPNAEPVSVRAFREADGTRDWPVLGDGACAFFRTSSIAESAQFVQAISALDGIAEQPRAIDIRADGVTIRLITYRTDYYGMSRRDIETARAISALALEMGLESDRSRVQSVGPIVVGATDIGKVMPFWRALMGYEIRTDSPDADIVDPRDRSPGIWFETVEGSRDERNRMHVAVWVPFDQAEARVAAALEAGGTILYDKAAPAWWTLADPEGNEADISTTMSRDEG